VIHAGGYAARRGGRAPALGVIGLGLTVVGMAGAIVADRSPIPFVALMGVVVAGTLLALSPRALGWRGLLVSVIVVILFIPIRRYTLPGNLPFQLEPYRLLIGIVGLGWLASLLVDPRVKFVRGAIFVPMVTMVVVCFASVVVNVRRVQELNVSSDVLKQFTFLLSFVLVFFLILSVIHRFDQIESLLRWLVGGGAVVAFFALIELNTGVNVFNQLARVFPFLQWTGGPTDNLVRAGRLRVMASAQHPIGLGELLVLLIPMAIYIAVATKRRIWFLAALVLGVGSFSTVSRTAIVSLVAIGIVYLILRPSSTLKFWPLIIPGLFAVHVAMPGVLGSMYKGLFPKEGLIAREAGAPVGSSRTASFGPGFHQVKLRPLFGGGYGTRIPIGPNKNSFIVDDQWLSTGMEIGFAGVFAWVWIFVSFIRRMFRAARSDDSPRGWLFVGCAAAATGFAVGMATYDSFSFIQATLVLFILLALGCAGLRAREEEGNGPATA
jgi:O-antigen ligase